MLHAVLAAVENAAGPVSLDRLGQQLGIAPAALQGMLDFWVRKGRLRRVDAGVEAACGQGHCGISCPGPAACPFAATLPRSYEPLSRPADAAPPSRRY